MTTDPEDFVSYCTEVIDMVESLGDEVLEVTADSTIESLGELSPTVVEQHEDSFLFGVNVRRNATTYTILTSPGYEYFEVYFRHNLRHTVYLDQLFDTEDYTGLSDEELTQRLEDSEMPSAEELNEKLAENRTRPLSEINSGLHRALASQSGCTFELNYTPQEDPALVLLTRKVFVQEDDFSLSDMEEAVVSIVNTGRQVKQLTAEFYGQVE